MKIIRFFNSVYGVRYYYFFNYIKYMLHSLNRYTLNATNTVSIITSESLNISSTIQEISVSIEERAIKIKNISKHLQDISTHTDELSVTLEEIDSLIKEMTSNAISESSRNTDNIYKISNEIQTRIEAIINDGLRTIKTSKKLYKEKENNTFNEKENKKIIQAIKAITDSIHIIISEMNISSEINADTKFVKTDEIRKRVTEVVDEIHVILETMVESVPNMREIIFNLNHELKNPFNDNQDLLTFINNNLDSNYKLFLETALKYDQDTIWIKTFSEKIASETIQILNSIKLNNMDAESVSNTEKLEDVDETTTNLTGEFTSLLHRQAELSKELNSLIQKLKI